tara:strand:+ start:33348 stop:33590 length:243 start_codon:yes stop_codon:yes gene_type:complete
MPLFNIIKHCQNEKNKCEVSYLQQNTAGNNPTISRRFRFAEIVRNRKYKRITKRVEAQGQGILTAESIYQPQVFAMPSVF